MDEGMDLLCHVDRADNPGPILSEGRHVGFVVVDEVDLFSAVRTVGYQVAYRADIPGKTRFAG